MLDLTGSQGDWPADLKPRGDGFDRESFELWWERCETLLPGIHPRAAEQWIHRHWSLSDYYGLPLEGLASRVEHWPAEKILADVLFPYALHPQWNYGNLKGSPTGKLMREQGTWDYPLLVLSTPQGFELRTGAHPDRRFCLIEGHQRYRFLHAMHERGETRGDHQIVVLEYRG